MAELRINDFSGGETDKFRDGKPNFAQRMRNLYITENKGFETRPGFQSIGSLQPFGSQRVDKVWHHHTQRISVGAANGLQDFETFIISNSAVRRNTLQSTNWETVEDKETGNSCPYFTTTQGTYVRLNDNEFLFVAFGKYPIKFFRESTGSEWSYVSLGLPRYNDTPTASVFGAAGTNNWGYALVLKHTYTTFDPGTGFLTRIVRSDPVFTDIVENVATTEIDLPEFSNSALGDYEDNEGDTVAGDAVFAYGDIVWEIYRTESNGSLYYFSKEVTDLSGTTTLESKTDDALISGEKLYTTDGVVGNGMTNDRIKFATYANDALWLASESRVWQAKVGIYDAVPGSFNFAAREGETITAIDTIDIYPIVLTTQGVYRIEGIVDDLGRGTHRLRTVLEDYGALSNKTTVKAMNQIFFLSSDGIYVTNGSTAQKVSHHYNDTYCEFLAIEADLSGTPIYAYDIAEGTYDTKNKRITWIYPVEGDQYSTKFLCMHLKYKNEFGYAITSGDMPYDATSVSAANGNLYMTSNDGEAVRQDPIRTSDVTTGASAVILWDYVGCSLSYGSALMRKWFTRLLLNLKNRGTAVTFDVLSATDERDVWRYHNGVDEPNFDRQKFLKRWFPKGFLRGTFKAIRFTNTLLATKPNSERIEMSGVTVIYTPSGEGHTQSDVVV